MDQYKIRKSLGFGAYGLAFEVYHKITKEKYCIKQVDLNKMKISYEVAKKEAELHLKLDNPNIIKVFKFFQERKLLFIVRELLKKDFL
jgi:polo-like kinase 1